MNMDAERRRSGRSSPPAGSVRFIQPGDDFRKRQRPDCPGL